MDRSYDVKTFFQDTFISRTSGVTNFADIIKTTFIDSKSVKIIRNYVLKCNL